MIKYMKIALMIVILILAYLLYTTIMEPIRFKQEEERRIRTVEQRMKDILKAQNAFKNNNGRYAEDFNSLIQFIKQDTFTVFKIIGNPDDTTQVVDTLIQYIPVRDSLFTATYPVDSLPYVPYGKGKKFNMSAGETTRGRVKIPVFEVQTSYADIFHDWAPKHYDRQRILRIGSLD